MRVTAIISATLLVVMLAGCAQQGATGSGSSSEPRVEPTASETAGAVAPVFSLPAACVDILPPSRQQLLEANGDVLLGGPGGVYGDDYLLDASPEQEAGGITCIWGPPDTELSTVTVSVAPLDATSRAAVVNDLAVGQGLNETTGEGATYYWLLGDRDRQPAILNVLTEDSWISVIQTIGGIDNYADAEKIAAEMHDQVYN